MSITRKVIGPNGNMMMKTFPSKSVEEVTTNEPEQKSDESIKDGLVIPMTGKEDGPVIHISEAILNGIVEEDMHTVLAMMEEKGFEGMKEMLKEKDLELTEEIFESMLTKLRLELFEVPSTELTIPMIRAMEPQEMRVVAKELEIKLGNVKKKDKMQNKLIKELKLEEGLL